MRAPRVITSAMDKATGPEPPSAGCSRSKRAADEFDTAIGSRIRAARSAAKMSLEALGQAVGVAHQQVHKYEAGKDRVAASMLQRIAIVLNLHPGWFFDDVPLPGEPIPDMAAQQRSSGDLQRIPQSHVRKQVLNSAKALAEQDGDEMDGPAIQMRDGRRGPVS